MQAKPLAKKLLFFSPFAVTILLWAMGKPSVDFYGNSPLNFMAQLAGLMGIVALAWNFVLASRFMFLDRMFGGLDKVFKTHRKTGTWAFTLMLAHPLLILATMGLQWTSIKAFVLPGAEWSINFGIFALWGFTLLIFLTLFAKLPYHIWKRTHQFMGIPFFLIALHVLTIDSDVAVNMPLRYWVLSLVVLGLSAYVYKVFLYRFIGPRYAYKAVQVKPLGDVTELLLEPVKRSLNFRPGQFVFISTDDKAVGREPHPFTISSSPDEKMLRLSVKKSGDYTKRLAALNVGGNVKVYGPYGRFGERFLTSKEKFIWIAGGIGVTPFLSLLRFGHEHKMKNSVDFFYTTRSKEEACYLDEIKTFCDDMPSVTCETRFSEGEGRLTAESIAEKVDSVKDKVIFLCGPVPMMHSMRDAFMEMGVKRRNIVFEDFSLR